jgi:hypothetical protein
MGLIHFVAPTQHLVGHVAKLSRQACFGHCFFGIIDETSEKVVGILIGVSGSKGG